LTPGPKDVRASSTAGRIFRAINERRELSSEVKRTSGHRHIDFDSLKGRLVGERIKVFKDNQKKKSPSPDNLRPSNLFTARGFRLSELSPGTRQWYEGNRGEILYQT
jgi:hypothetical protein